MKMFIHAFDRVEDSLQSIGFGSLEGFVFS